MAYETVLNLLLKHFDNAALYIATLKNSYVVCFVIIYTFKFHLKAF